MNYDLEERTAKFGENMIDFVKSLNNDYILKPLISQIVRSSTSIGANYMEANQASSKKDFRNKIQISRKESNETKHWLRMIAKASPGDSLKCRELWKEAHALTLIFSKISRSSAEDTK
ncbi:MAG: four helix bundle protein [Candidatus Pacebacteria bacterium]|nr:four helix bundle protein [Candidatus Paceibacterota bacterium]MBP9716267.1 four helix bundle protein [Candidatus Paceibacterota bacterium]